MKNDVHGSESDLFKMLDRKANFIDVQEALSHKANSVEVQQMISKSEVSIKLLYDFCSSKI